jgi:hypothetical protein
LYAEESDVSVPEPSDPELSPSRYESREGEARVGRWGGFAVAAGVLGVVF